ncbi:MAG: hypothetical protein ACREUL_15605 [Steroidobacteraceae bacterium]
MAGKTHRIYIAILDDAGAQGTQKFRQRVVERDYRGSIEERRVTHVYAAALIGRIRHYRRSSSS